MDSASFRDLIEAVNDVLYAQYFVDEVIVYDPASDETHVIQEGKWINTNTSNSIRIDHATHGVGQTHAHIYARKGNEIGVVNLDGTGSHGTKNLRLPKDVAQALRDHNFEIPRNRMVEWRAIPQMTRTLLFS